MPALTLDDLMAVNDQLAALALAGVPMQTGLSPAQGGFETSLQQVNSELARRVSQGASLDQALSDATHSVPPLYACLLRVAARTGDVTAALGASNRLAESRVRSQYAAAFSLVYPAIVFMLAYVGLVGFCLFLAPVLEGMHQSMAIRPRLGLLTLTALRASLPYWVALPPLGLALGVALARRQSRRQAARARWSWPWLPGLAKADYENRAANFAQSLAALLDGGLDVEDALAIAAPALETDSRPSPSSAAAATPRWPPFLQWAMFQSQETIGRQAALATAADIYRASARRRLARWQAVAPIVLCIVVGGGITLLYGLALFVPLVDMLKGLAS